MNQVVSAALVAQREVEEESSAAVRPSDDKPEPSSTGSGASKAKPSAKFGADKVGSAQANEVIHKEKMM